MKNWMWIVLAAAVVIGGILLFGNIQQATPPAQGPIGGGPGASPAQNRMEIQLDPVNQDQIDQSGRATLEESDGKVTVMLDVNQIEGLNNQPAHIHAGSCPGVGEITFPLSNVADGRSVTEINTTLDQLRSNPMAINIHKSAIESAVYTACGELPR
ncbi:hypothetical protein HYW43_05355 [Candidatus Daviesbacteria bacterium]|nr:hypothetical protein [Candidatus Daviesbacteria bacterium]